LRAALFKKSSTWRIIDANLNRAKEGLRVCEEVARFILACRTLTARFKRIRHAIDRLLPLLPAQTALLTCRQARGDVGRPSSNSEMRRGSVADIFFANMQRVKESLRVLEEFTKLADTKVSAGFKGIRYDIYEIEKKFATKLTSLRHHRS
jgi:thiamine-phosphate pyrophosphorylase